jgi:hypothetical protein
MHINSKPALEGHSHNKVFEIIPLNHRLGSNQCTPIASLWFFKTWVSQCKMWSPDLLEPAAARPQNLHACCSSTPYSLSVTLFHVYRVSAKLHSAHGIDVLHHHAKPLYASRSSADTVWRREIAWWRKIFFCQLIRQENCCSVTLYEN